MFFNERKDGKFFNLQTNKPRKKQCPNCNGTGTTFGGIGKPVNCRTCKGKGKIK